LRYPTARTIAIIFQATPRRGCPASGGDCARARSEFELKLKVLHDARDSAAAEIVAARKDLLSFLTPHQEGVLVALGLLE
jgi:hypothetical protein